MTTERRETYPTGDLVLHHYWMSPYAEKVRCILGFKLVGAITQRPVYMSHKADAGRAPPLVQAPPAAGAAS